MVSIAFARITLTLVTLLLPLPALILQLIVGDVSRTSPALSIVSVAAAGLAITVLATVLGSKRLAHAVGSFADRAAEWAAPRIHRTLDLDLTERLFALRQGSRQMISERGLATTAAATSVRLSDFLLFLLAIRFVGLGSDVFGTTTLFAIFAPSWPRPARRRPPTRTIGLAGPGGAWPASASRAESPRPRSTPLGTMRTGGVAAP